MATIKFSEFTRATDPTGFDVAGLQDGTNKIIDSSLIGDGKYVPYESDGKSVAALDGGALMIGEHDIAKVVPAEGDLTNMADYESLLGINVNGMQIEWNGNLPFTPPSIVLFAASITLFEDPDTGYALYVVANAEELGFPSGSFIFMYSSEMNSVLPIYVNGNFESAMLVVGFPVPEYTQGWNTQITKFSTDLRYSPSELRGDLTSTDTYWNLDKAFIGYPEPDRIEIGDGENPVKILHLEGERVIEAEVDAIGEITAEHTLARTSDIPTDQHIEEIVRNVSPPSSISRTDVTNMFTTSVPVEDFHVEKVDFGEGEKPLIRMWGQDTSGTANQLVITAANGFGSYYNNTGADAFTMHGKLIDDGSGNRTASHYPVDVTGETDLAQTTITFAPEIGHFDITYFLGQTTALRTSYYVDNNGVTHEFNRDNTPISNLCTSGAENTDVIINGQSITKQNITEISIGDEYVGDFNSSLIQLLLRFNNLSIVSFPNNATTLGNYCLNNTSTTKLNSIIFPSSNFAIGTNSFGYMDNLSTLDLSNVISIGTNSFRYNTAGTTALRDVVISEKLTSIASGFLSGFTSITNIYCGGFDASLSGISSSIFVSIVNQSIRIRYHATQDLADKFVAKFPQFSNWTVVIQP